jgi:hypothetical protein
MTTLNRGELDAGETQKRAAASPQALEGVWQVVSGSQAVDAARIAEFWEALDAAERTRRLDALHSVFTNQIENAKKTSRYYSSVYLRRMRRYNLLRIVTVILMIGGLITQLLYNGMERSFGLDKLVTVFAPVLLGAAVIFYVTQALLKDYEVAIEAGKISETMLRLIDRVEARWVTEVIMFGSTVNAAVSANQIVVDMSRCQVELDSFLAAERAATLSDLKSISSG